MLELKKIPVNIELLSSVVITSSKGETILTEAGDRITGSIIRSMFAKNCIDVQGLGKKAHENESFVELFFNKLSFVDAMPLCNGMRSFISPRCLLKGKAGTDDASIVQDLTRDTEHRAGFKNIKGIVVVKDGSISPVKVNKNISMHINRSGDSKRIAGKTNDGGIFNYESISAGQIFQGEIIGKEADLRELLNLSGINQGAPYYFYIGRSKNTQYGKCRMKIDSIESIVPAIMPKDNEPMVIRLDTPYIPVNNMAFDCRMALQEIAKEIGDGVYIGNIWGAIEEEDNFVAVWGMRRPRVSAVAPGTVFTLKKDGKWNEDELEKLHVIMYGGVGVRKEEGFGQLRVWNEPHLTVGNTVDCKSADIGRINHEGKAAEIARKIARRYIISKMRQYAYNDVQKIGNLSGMSHFFTRMDNLLGDKTNLENIKEDYRGRICREQGNATQFDRYLVNLCLGEYTLIEILRDMSYVPYKKAWNRELNNNNSNIRDLLEEIGMVDSYDVTNGEYFYEYWHWFFRYGRKMVSSNSNGGDN